MAVHRGYSSKGEEIDADTAEYALSLKQSGEKVMGLTEDFQVLVGTVND